MHSPLDSYFPPAVRFTACFSLALLTHLVLYIVLNDLRLPHIEDKTVLPSVRLVSATASSVQSVPTTTQSKKSSTISTTGQSQFSTSKVEQTKKVKTKSVTPKKTNQAKPESPQNTRQKRARNSLKELFSKSKSAAPSAASNKKVSTKDAPLLSDYEQKLINHMVKPELYDRFHQAMRSNPSVTYDIQLTLLQHGAIRSAKIKRSSGISEIDELAVTAAYNASPYPRPPSEDQIKGFTYLIPVEYVAKDQASSQ